MNLLKLVRGGEDEEVVTLDTVAKNPTIVDSLDLEAMRDLMAKLEMAQGALRSRWFIVNTAAVLAARPEPEDQMLTVKEAAMRIGLSVDTLYRNADDYPFTRRPRGRMLRFSARGIDEWLKSKRST